jgi:hypothetical protein
MHTKKFICRRLLIPSGVLLMSPVLAAFFCAATAFSGDNVKESPGFVMELPEKESDVLPIVQDVAADSIIRGTYAYERDKELTGAMPAKSSNAFGQWQGPGQVFYKVVTGVLAPRHFLDSADIGTVTVRYVVEPAGEARTRVRIDAIFIEEGRRKAHRSDGTVESSEFKGIQDRLQELQLAKQKTEEERQQAATNLKKREEESAAESSALRERQEEKASLDAAESSIRDLEQRRYDLQREVELRVKAKIALKAAPFRKSAALVSLEAGTDVIVLIVTPNWYGVQTPDGHRGWLRRDETEQLP